MSSALSSGKSSGHVAKGMVCECNGGKELGSGPNYRPAVPQIWGDDPGKSPQEGPLGWVLRGKYKSSHWRKGRGGRGQKKERGKGMDGDEHGAFHSPGAGGMTGEAREWGWGWPPQQQGGFRFSSEGNGEPRQDFEQGRNTMGPLLWLFLGNGQEAGSL